MHANWKLPDACNRKEFELETLTSYLVRYHVRDPLEFIFGEIVERGVAFGAEIFPAEPSKDFVGPPKSAGFY